MSYYIYKNIKIHNNDTGMSKSKIVCEECQDGTKMETR